MKRGQSEPVQVKCSKCDKGTFWSLPVDELPAGFHPDGTRKRMVIEALLDGKK
jgi:hypothetical protein